MSFDQATHDSRIEDLMMNEHFQVLGYGDGVYFFRNKRTSMIVRLTGRRVRMTALLELAPAQWWAENFPAKRGAIDKLRVVDFAFCAARRAGEFDKFSTGVAE